MSFEHTQLYLEGASDMQSPIPPAMAHCAVEWGLYKEAKERYNYVPPTLPIFKWLVCTTVFNTWHGVSSLTIEKATFGGKWLGFCVFS